MSKAAVELDSGEKIPVVDFSGLTDRNTAMRAATAAGMRAAFEARRNPRSFRRSRPASTSPRGAGKRLVPAIKIKRSLAAALSMLNAGGKSAEAQFSFAPGADDRVFVPARNSERETRN